MRAAAGGRWWLASAWAPRLLAAALLGAALLLGQRPPAAASVLAPAEAVARARELDGSVVQVRGEAIGEALRADAEHCWVNVLGDGRAIGVWVPNKLAERLGAFGEWASRGDIVVVAGVIHAGCDQHGGDLDIHAGKLSVEQAGEAVAHPIRYWKGAVGIALIGFAAALAYRYELRRRRLEV